MTVDPYAELRARPERERATRLRVRCGECGKLLAEMVTAPWLLRCPRCKQLNRSAEDVTSAR